MKHEHGNIEIGKGESQSQNMKLHTQVCLYFRKVDHGQRSIGKSYQT